MTTDGLPPRSHTHPLDAIRSAKLRAFLRAALHPFRQYGGRAEADRLGEEWIGAEIRGDFY